MRRKAILVLILTTTAFTWLSAEESNPPAPVQLRVDVARLPGEPPIDTAIVRKGPAALHPAHRSAPAGAASAATVKLAEIPETELAKETAQRLFSHIQGAAPLDDRQIIGDGPDTVRSAGPSPLAAESPPPRQPGATKAAGDSAYSFDGIANTGWIPPDTIHTVGPNHVVAATNSHFAVYSKLGVVKRSLTSFSTFFNIVTPAGWQGYFFDPRVIYTIDHDKYVFAVLGTDSTNQTSHCFVAVSQTNDPTGEWWMWRFDQDGGNSADADSWWDYQSLGADQWGLYLTGNYFYWVGGWKHSIIWSISPNVFSGGVATGWVYWDLRWPDNSMAFSPQVMHPHSTAGGGETFFVNSYSSSGNVLCLWTLTGDRTSSPTLTSASVSTWQYDAIFENVDQPDVADDIDGGDTRILNGIYSQRKAFVTLTTDPDDDGTMAGAYVAKLNVDSATAEWQDLIYTTDYYYFYPAVSVAGGSSADANVALFMSYTGPTTYAGGAVKVYTNQPTDGTGPFWATAGGSASYVDRDSNNRNRWGDYSGAVYDWTTEHFWGAVEYAGTSNTWRTKITAVTADAESPFTGIDVIHPNGGQIYNAGDSVTVSWASANINPTFDVYVYLYDGSTYHQQSDALSPSTSSWSWTVPGTATTSGRIYVGAWTGSEYNPADLSDEVFTINGTDEIFSHGFEGGDFVGWSNVVQ